jgi:hypothetical protein
MAFQNHSIRDAQWGSFYRIPETDTQYPPITAHTVDRREFSDDTVEFDTVFSRFAIGVEDTRGFSNVSTVTNHSISSGTEVLAANLDRKGFKVWNEGGAGVFILEGSGTASATNQTLTLGADELYTSSTPVWTGRVHIVSSSGTQAVVVTEYA